MPCIVMTSLYEFFVEELLARRRELRAHEEREDPAARRTRTSEVAMYMIPIRLWSTVTSQLATRPFFQPTG